MPLSKSPSLLKFPDPFTMVALTVELIISLTKVAPSTLETIIEGIVIVGSVPPIANTAPATLLIIITATAPAACALATLVIKLQVPL